MERRDFFKLFAAGATVVPVLGEMPSMQARAKLIETPKIEILAPVSNFDYAKLGEQTLCRFEITLRDRLRPRESFHMTAENVEIHCQTAIKELYSQLCGYPVADAGQTRWTLTAECVAGILRGEGGR